MAPGEARPGLYGTCQRPGNQGGGAEGDGEAGGGAGKVARGLGRVAGALESGAAADVLDGGLAGGDEGEDGGDRFAERFLERTGVVGGDEADQDGEGEALRDEGEPEFGGLVAGFGVHGEWGMGSGEWCRERSSLAGFRKLAPARGAFLHRHVPAGGQRSGAVKGRRRERGQGSVVGAAGRRSGLCLPRKARMAGW